MEVDKENLVTPEAGFKSAKELKMPESYRVALCQVLYMLENDCFTWNGNREQIRKNINQNKKGVPLFDMGSWKREHECGTVGCMGGWAQFFNGGKKPTNSYDDVPGLNELFFPPGYFFTDDYPPEKCAKALRGFLETGETNWD